MSEHWTPPDPADDSFDDDASLPQQPHVPPREHDIWRKGDIAHDVPYMQAPDEWPDPPDDGAGTKTGGRTGGS